MMYLNLGFQFLLLPDNLLEPKHMMYLNNVALGDTLVDAA